MFLDVFTCGDRADPELAMQLLAEALARVVHQDHHHPARPARHRAQEESVG